MRTIRVPVHRGGEVVAHALVDEADAPGVERYRWTLSSNGYAVRSVRNGDHGCRHMHRFVLGLRRHDGQRVDHRDGNPLNNSRSNLHVGTASDNGQNRKRQWRAMFGYRGTWRTRSGRWLAYATLDRKRRCLGTFASEREAALVAASFRAERMPLSVEAERRERGLPVLYQGPLAGLDVLTPMVDTASTAPNAIMYGGLQI